MQYLQINTFRILSLLRFYYFIIDIFFASFLHKIKHVVFHCKSPQASKNLQCIVVDPKITVVRMVSILPLSFDFSSLLSKTLGSVPCPPTTIDDTFSFLFTSFIYLTSKSQIFVHVFAFIILQSVVSYVWKRHQNGKILFCFSLILCLLF